MPQMLGGKLFPGKGKPLQQVWDTKEPGTALRNIRATPLPELKPGECAECGSAERAGLVLAVRGDSDCNVRACFRALANTS